MTSYYLAIMTTIVWGIVPVFEKMGLSNLSFQAGVFVRCLSVFFGAFLLLIFSPSILPELAKAPMKNIGLIIVSGFSANFIGQLLFYSALKDGQVSKVVPIVGAYPLIAFVMGILILGETLTVGKSVGIFFILIGVVLLR